MKVEIETTTAIPDLMEVYNYLKDLETKGFTQTIEKVQVQSIVHVLIKQLEWAIEDKIKKVDNDLDFLREEAEDMKMETGASFIKEAL